MEHWRLERWRSSHAMPCRMRILPASRHMWKAFGSGRVDTVVSRVAASMWRVAAAGSPVSLYGFRKETTSLQERNFVLAERRSSQKSAHSVHKTMKQSSTS